MRRLSARRRGALERELRDAFAYEPAAIASNFAGIASLALSGVRTDGGNAFGDDIAIARMRGIHRAGAKHERALTAFRELAPADQNVLWFAFGPHQLAPEVRTALGTEAGAALFTEAARKGCQKAAGTRGEPSREQVGAWLLGRAVAGDTAALAPVVEGLGVLLEATLLAYADARGERSPRPRRPRKTDDGGSFFSPEGYGL